MDAIKSCSTKQQCSIKVYLRDILHPYVNLQSGFFGGGEEGGAEKYIVLHIVFFPRPSPPKKLRLPLRFPGFSRFCLYFSSSFLNISSRCSNEILYVESNHKLGGQTRTLLGASLYLVVFWIYYKLQNRQMWQLITVSIRGKMYVKCFFILWCTHRGHRGNLSNWHHFLCSFCSTYDLVTEMYPSLIKRKLLFRYAEKKYNNTWLTCSKHLIATVTL